MVLAPLTEGCTRRDRLAQLRQPCSGEGLCDRLVCSQRGLAIPGPPCLRRMLPVSSVPRPFSWQRSAVVVHAEIAGVGYRPANPRAGGASASLAKRNRWVSSRMSLCK